MSDTAKEVLRLWDKQHDGTFPPHPMPPYDRKPQECDVCSLVEMARRELAAPTGMSALEAALRGLACRCHGDEEGHEVTEHLTPGEREVFEQVGPWGGPRAPALPRVSRP